MKAYQVENILCGIQKKITLEEHQLFLPRERHIELSLDKKRGIDPQPYMQMRTDGQEADRLHEELVPKLVYFLNKTKNSPLAREVRDNLG